MMRRFLIPFLLLLPLALTGCQSQEVNNTSAALGIGADLSGDQIKMSLQMARPLSPQQAASETPFITASGVGTTAGEALRNMSLSIPRHTLWAHASAIFLSDTLARQDLALITDILVRNPDIRKSTHIFITTGYSTEEIMSSTTPLEPYSSVAMRDLVQTQEKQLGIYTATTAGEFIYALTTPGIDPLVPQVTLISQGGQMIPTLSGSAAFKGRKLVGVLDETESRGYRRLKPGMIRGGIIIIPSPLDSAKKVSLELIRSETEVKPVITDNRVKMEIEIVAEGNFYEQNSTGEILTAENVPLIEDLANQEIMRQCRASIARAQTLNSDIFGWGRELEAALPNVWNEVKSDWYNVFPLVEVDLKVDFSIRRSYLTDRSFVFR